MRQITESFDTLDTAIAAGFDDLDATAGALDDQAKIPAAACGLQWACQGE
jgi:hypothetical protein